MAFAALEALARATRELERAGLKRTRRILDSAQDAVVDEGGARLVNFSSNDYLGLANEARLREAAHRAIDAFGVGAGASPLVTGHTRLHQEAEARFADFIGRPRALLFASGYAANIGILASLGDRHAEIFADKWNHACLVDGAVLSRATFTRYPHGDMDTLAHQLARSTAATRIVATDTVFSMDGDIAPLERLLALCETHDAWLVLDDAHGFGVIGEGGRGALAHGALDSPRIVYMATLGKALGGYGAFVTGAPEVVEWLVQRARTYVFSTALPPAVAAVASAALDILAAEPERVARLHARIAQLRRACEARDVAITPSITAIQPVIVGDARRAVALSSALRERGFLVPAIRPPTVPEGTSRLRVSLSSSHTPGQVESLAAALAGLLAQ